MSVGDYEDEDDPLGVESKGSKRWRRDNTAWAKVQNGFGFFCQGKALVVPRDVPRYRYACPRT